MLDLPRIRRLKLSSRPLGHRVMGVAFLGPNYLLPPRVKIRFEQAERIPSGPVIYAMNHTDRYNYWPLQFQLWRKHRRYTAAWVKGKYYEHPAMAWFMEQTNNLPVVSRGYLVVRDFLSVVGRVPNEDEYAALRAAVEAAAVGEPVDLVAAVPAELLTQRRDMLGRLFDPDREHYAEAVSALFGEFMGRFVALNGEALRAGLDLVIFPEGTRSIRMQRGHIGLAEIALKFRTTIVPVACNGSDQVYPGGSPVARPGTITYRFGEPITYEQMAPFAPAASFEPFTPSAESAYRSQFQALVDLVMARIEPLLDERHRPDQSAGSGARDARRFL